MPERGASQHTKVRELLEVVLFSLRDGSAKLLASPLWKKITDLLRSQYIRVHN